MQTKNKTDFVLGLILCIKFLYIARRNSPKVRHAHKSNVSRYSPEIQTHSGNALRGAFVHLAHTDLAAHNLAKVKQKRFTGLFEFKEETTTVSFQPLANGKFKEPHNADTTDNACISVRAENRQ